MKAIKTLVALAFYAVQIFVVVGFLAYLHRAFH